MFSPPTFLRQAGYFFRTQILPHVSPPNLDDGSPAPLHFPFPLLPLVSSHFSFFKNWSCHENTFILELTFRSSDSFFSFSSDFFWTCFHGLLTYFNLFFHADVSRRTVLYPPSKPRIATSMFPLRDCVFFLAVLAPPALVRFNFDYPPVLLFTELRDSNWCSVFFSPLKDILDRCIRLLQSPFVFR